MRKRHLSLLLPLLCLNACGSIEYPGTYSFLLGRQGENKIGISMTLTDAPFQYSKNVAIFDWVVDHDGLVSYDKTTLTDGAYIYVLDDSPVHEGHYYYQFIASLNDFVEIGSDAPTEPAKYGKKFKLNVELGNAVKEIPEFIQKAIKSGIVGYYIPQPQSSSYGQRLGIGGVFKKEFIPGLEYVYQLIADEVGPELAEIIEHLIETSDSMIDPNLIQKIIVAYCNGNNLTLQVPVSLEDFQIQLTWYGDYYDISPTIKNRIHSFKDLLNNLVDLITNFRAYDLKNHKELFVRPGETERRLISLPGGKSIQGDNRIGTHPGDRLDGKSDADQKDRDTQKDVDEMNYHYANEFSNTLVYEDAEHSIVKGAITSHTTTINNVTTTSYYYYDRSDNPDPTISEVEGYIGLYNEEYDVYDNYKRVKFTVASENAIDYELGLLIDKTEIISGAIEEVDPYYYYQKPFTFRDQHDIKVGLAKE